MTYLVEYEQELQEVIKDNLEDPNTERNEIAVKTGQETGNRFPWIQINFLDNQKDSYSLGTTDQLNNQRIQVSVQVKQKAQYVIDNENKSAGYTKKYLAERIDEIVQANQQRFENLGNDFFTLLPDSDNPVSPGNTRQTVNQYILRKTVST
jgi:hypothetical protein